MSTPIKHRLPGWFPRILGVSVLLCAFSILPTAGAKESDGRTVKLDLSQQKAVIESESRAAHRGDKLKIEFDNASHHFLLEYESEDADAKLEAEVKVELFDLIEWRDSNQNGRYDPEVASELVQKIGLGDLTPRALERSSVTIAGQEGVKLVGSTANPSKYPHLKLVLTLYVFGELLKIEQAEVEPTALKFDILIEGFPFSATDTALALHAKSEIESEGKVSGVAGSGEEAIAARVGKFTSFFSWSKTVTVDGQTKSLQPAVLKEESKSGSQNSLVTELYLLYPRGNSILHDPQLGVRLPAINSGTGCN